MAQLLIHNAQLVLPDRVREGGVLIRDRCIAAVFSHDQMPTGFGASESLDLAGAVLIPGLIDIHIHGSAGVDVQNTDSDGLSKLSDFLLSEGVAGYFATIVPTDDRGYRSAIDSLELHIAQQPQRLGAKLLGIHFEGPYLNQNKCGALRPEHFRSYDGDPGSLGVFVKPASYPRLMTVAPEVAGGIELTRELARSGLGVFVGHSLADIATLDLALEAGARHITHFPNALGQLHHRMPGAIGWGLVCRSVTLDCIADLQHVDPVMLRLIYQSKGSDRICLISDAIQPAGLGDGDFRVWGISISVRNGRTALANGALAGSVMSLRQAVKNMVSIGVSLPEAVKMASLLPATIAGIARDHGSIEPGKQADLVSIDENFEVGLAIVGGNPRVRR